MNITRETVGDVLVVGPQGKLDYNSAKDLENLLLDALGGGVEHILFDFSSVVYISSSGLRVVLLTVKKVQEGTGTVALCGLSENVSQVFEISGLARILNIESSREVALARFFLSD